MISSSIGSCTTGLVFFVEIKLAIVLHVYVLIKRIIVMTCFKFCLKKNWQLFKVTERLGK